VYQRIGFQCFTETLFEDAGKHLFNGELDPRLLVSYFPELRGGLFTADDAMDVFAGVAEHMPQENSVDDISESLSYSLPPLSYYSTPPLVALPRHPLTYLLLPFSLSLHPRAMFLSFGTDFQLCRT
jgi:vacuolar protein sorting-associated protein 3